MCFSRKLSSPLLETILSRTFFSTDCCGWLLIYWNTSVLLIYFLVVVAYVFKCRYDLSAPYCPAINYAFVFVMTSPTAFLLYMLYKRHSLDRASARRQVSVTDVEPVTVLPAIAEARSDMGA